MRRAQQTLGAPQTAPFRKARKKLRRNAFVVHDICFSVYCFGNVTAPRSFSRGFSSETIRNRCALTIYGSRAGVRPSECPHAGDHTHELNPANAHPSHHILAQRICLWVLLGLFRCCCVAPALDSDAYGAEAQSINNRRCRAHSCSRSRTRGNQ